jgi:O86/O127-antigen biosynthesis alpha-1,3-N-acetylgalactosaminyltransferase
LKNKKILFIVTKTIVGGAQKFISDQIKMLHQEGFELFLATADDRHVFQHNKNLLSAFLLDKRIEKKTSISYLFDLKSFITKNNIDLVICNSANGGLYGRLAAFLANKKSIYVSHGWSSIYNGGKLSFLLNKVETILALVGNKVLCISENDAYLAKNVIKVPQNKIVTIPNCIFPQEKYAIRKQKEHYKIIFLGRLSHPKKPELLMQAVKNISNVTLYIVGTGENDSFYEDIIAKNQLKNVILMGEISNFNDFENYDIFSLISLSEGLPMSVLEAMSSGMPMVLSNIKGCIPLINNNGTLAENNPESIAENIIKTIENIEEFSKNSIKIFDENYNMNTNKQKYIELYKSLI